MAQQLNEAEFASHLNLCENMLEHIISLDASFFSSDEAHFHLM
jgi:hypothetical protein